MRPSDGSKPWGNCWRLRGESTKLAAVKGVTYASDVRTSCEARAMKPLIAAALSIGLMSSVVADDKRTPPAADFSTVAPENDSRLAKLKDAQPKKIGILTYYANQGGGYTFLQGNGIVFYALPYTPSTYKCEVQVAVRRGVDHFRAAVPINVPTIGTSIVPLDGQTVYQTDRVDNGKGGFFRRDLRLAYWSRDTPDSNFHFWILAEDRETKLKVKSIVPVLERGR
jgi:hypothetical protein